MDADIAIIGAGAAGLAAAIAAAEAGSASSCRIILLDSARKPGAKILVSGGGRCNVTNEHAVPDDFWGGPRTIIQKTLQKFDTRQTIAWFAGMGVRLKLEVSKKYFPVTDRAQTVLDALLRRTEQLGVTLVTSLRIADLRPAEGGFQLVVAAPHGADGRLIRARRVIVATGGKSLPKSGSDGAMLEVMRRLGHTVVPTTPALAPLTMRQGAGPGGRFAEFSGVSLDARLRLYQSRATASGTVTPRLLVELAGPLLFAHFGISGPAALDLSRHWLRARLEQPELPVAVFFGLPRFRIMDDADHWLLQEAAAHPRQHIVTALTEVLPERLARAMAAECTDDEPLAHLPRERRQALARLLTMLPLPVTGSRGYQYAEATAGGIDLHDIDARTMQSRRIPGLYLCGEILDVDGRIGGFNFQWAWSSGHVAGHAAAASP